jgi:transcriptional regulator with XRE-family HTH domain
MTGKHQQLLAWKEQQGLSVTELARRLGLDPGYISRILNGERPVGDAFVGRFAQVFGFDEAARVFGAAGEPSAEVQS